MERLLLHRKGRAQFKPDPATEYTRSRFSQPRDRFSAPAAQAFFICARAVKSSSMESASAQHCSTQAGVKPRPLVPRLSPLARVATTRIDCCYVPQISRWAARARTISALHRIQAGCVPSVTRLRYFATFPALRSCVVVGPQMSTP